MATCASCGTTSSDGASHCTQCGQVLSDTRKTSKLAVVALILAIIPCTTFIGLVLGIVALVRLSGAGGALKGKGLAIASICIPPLMIFVVGILAAIAIPNFVRFQSRAKQSEARSELRALYTASMSYQAEHDAPAARLADLDATFMSTRRYAYFVGDDAEQATVGGPYAIPPELAAQTRGPGVVAVAVGNVDSDPTLDVWSIDAHGKLTHLVDDIKE